MNNDFLNIINDASEEAISFLSENVIVSADTFRGIVSETSSSELFEEGGINEVRGISVVLPKLNRTFRIGESVVYAGKNYILTEIQSDIIGSTLICKTV